MKNCLRELIKSFYWKITDIRDNPHTPMFIVNLIDMIRDNLYLKKE